MPSRLLLTIAAVASIAAHAPLHAQTPGEDSLPAHLVSPLGYTVTGGAAPGYIEDAACGVCHADRWSSYQKIGMSRSFTRPRPDVFIEDFDAEPYFHEPSERYYQMVRRGDELVFRR